MTTLLPDDARSCTLPGVFVTRDARVFREDKSGYKELNIKADKKCIGKFYYNKDKKYHSLTQAYAEAFVPTEEGKPMALIVDSGKGLSQDNLMWVTNDEWNHFCNTGTLRQCKCCGASIGADAGTLCDACLTKMKSAESEDADEAYRFKNREAAPDEESCRFNGRQKDVLELHKSGEPDSKIADVIGCDEDTAKKCVKSAEVARKLERISEEKVTPIGYKSLADVVPAERGTGKQKKAKMHRSEPLTDVYVKAEVPVCAEPEEIEPEWYEQESIVRADRGVEDDHNESKMSLISKFLKFSIKTIKMCLQLALKIEQGERVEIVPSTPLEEEPCKCVTLNCKQEASNVKVGVPLTEAKIISEPVKQEQPVLLVMVDRPSVNQQGVNQQSAPQRKEASELSILFDEYRQLGADVPFSSFCKVYWVASKYSSENALQLTRLVVRYAREKSVVLDVTTINNALRAGMQALASERQ